MTERRFRTVVVRRHHEKVNQKHPALFVPGQFVEPTGLVRLSGIGAPAPPAGEAEIVRGILGVDPAVAIGSPPSFFDQVHVWMTHQELASYIPEVKHLAGVAEITGERVLELIRGIPFAPAMRFVSSLQKVIGLRYVDVEQQRQLFRAVYGEGPLSVAADAFLNAHERGALFFEQQLFALQRLLVLHASDEEADDLTPKQHVALRSALLYIPGTILSMDEEMAEAPELVEDERWLRYFVGNGGFVAHGSLMHEMARAHRMYEVVAKSGHTRDHDDFCPIDDWLVEAYGMTFVELQAFGFVMLAGSKVKTEDEPPLAIDPSYFDTTAFRGRTDEGLKAFAADREWFREEFRRSTETKRRIAFETHPFLRRPGLVQKDGTVLIVAPRAIEAWLGASGTYYRLFDIARAKGSETRKAFTRFNGALQEQYARHLMYVAYPDQPRRKLLGMGVVCGPRTYKVGKGREQLETTDIVIALGFDLVLIEVTAGRLTERSLVEADAESVLADLEKMVVKKTRQLGRVIGDIFDDPSRLPDVDLSLIKRVWPIVVSGDGLFQNPSLSDYTNTHAGKYLQFDRKRFPATVRPVFVLDLEELAALGGMIGAGLSLVDILELKTSDLWLARDFKAMATSALAHRWDEQPKFILEEYGRATAAVKRAVGLARGNRGPTVETPAAALDCVSHSDNCAARRGASGECGLDGAVGGGSRRRVSGRGGRNADVSQGRSDGCRSIL